MISKRIVLLIISVGLGLVIYWLSSPKYKFHYYYSKDKSQVLTRVTYSNTLFSSITTYFTPGHYEQYETPTTYVKPKYSSDGDWAVYVIFHSKGIFLKDGNSAEVRNLSDSFLYSYGNYYNEHRALDRLISTFKDTTKLTLYSFQD
jgi:hypothetical protein